MATSSRAPIFYGWVVVAAAFVCLLLIFGTAYSFAAFFASFAAEFDADRADVSLVFGLSGLLYFILGAPAGALSDRLGPRAICTSGMAVLAGGLFAASYATSLAVVYLAFGVGVGLGVALVYTPAMGSVMPWFVRRRGLAAGIASAGIGAGTLIIPVAAAWLIAELQWRSGLRVMALAIGLTGVSAAWLMEKNPARRGVGPDGGPPTDASRTAGHSALAGMTLREALRSPRFWWLYLATFATAPTMFTPFAHLSAHARDIGVEEAQAVALVGLIGVGSLTGRFAVGALADRVGLVRTLVLMQVLMIASYLLWWGAPGYTLLAVFAVSFGLFQGGIVSLLPPICMDLFGGRAVSAVMGVLYSAAALGNLAGPVAAGAAFDRFGSYTPVFLACAAASLVGVWGGWRLLRGERGVAQHTPGAKH